MTSPNSPAAEATESAPVNERFAPPQRFVSPGLGRIFILLLILICAYQTIKYLLLMPHLAPGVDYTKHHVAAVHLLNGENPFPPDNDRPYMAHYYPLFSAMIYIWLGFFDIKTGEVIWDLWNAALILLSALCVAKWYRPASLNVGDKSRGPLEAIKSFLIEHWWIVGPFLVLTFMPAVKKNYNGNIEPTLVLLLVAFGAALLQRRDAAAGALLACAGLVKVLPFFLIVPFPFAKRWRLVGGFLGVLAIYGLILAMLGWLPWEWYYFKEVLPAASAHWIEISGSIAFITARVFNPDALATAENFKSWASSINLGLIIPFTFGVLIVARKALHDWLLLAVNMAMLSPLMLTPLLEDHHYAWVLPPYLFLIRDWLNGKIRGIFYMQFPFWLLLIAALPLAEVKIAPLGVPAYAYGTFSAFVLWLLNGATLLWLRFHGEYASVGMVSESR